jgi:hypothetical protein
LLEFFITFAVILFAGFSVTFGVLLKKRTPVHGCHCEPEADSQKTASKCGSCQIIEARHESND